MTNGGVFVIGGDGGGGGGDSGSGCDSVLT